MKKRIITFLMTLAVVTVHLFAEGVAPKPKTDSNMFGEVIEATTGEHIPYAIVKLKGTTIGSTTDASGHYYITNLPLGKFDIEVSILGYKTTIQPVEIKEDVSIEVNFKLETEVMNLDAVVVTANRNQTNRMLAPALVSVLDTKILQKTNSTNLAQGLKFQPGLRVEDNCQNCGFTQLRVNGLEGPYSQILIDSRAVYGAMSGVYGLEQIPTNMIERVEVIRGGGSALFGSNAIGGVINIITKEPLRNSGSAQHMITSFGGNAIENNTMFNASVLTDNRKAGITLYGQYKDRQGYDYDGDGYTEMPELKNRSFGVRSFLKTGLYSTLTLEYHNMHEYRRGGDSLARQPFNANIAEQLEHYINGGSINYKYNSADLKNFVNIYASAQHTFRKSYYGGGTPFYKIDTIPTNVSVGNLQDINARLSSFGRSTELLYQIGGQYTREIDKFLFMPAAFTGGVEYSSNTLNDESGYRKTAIDQKANTMSAFAQNEWKDAHWSFLIGARLDKHSLVKTPILSPRANIRFNPNGNVNFRLSYSEGFRAPQYFDENLHIEVAGGDPIVHVLSEDLKEERSKSVSASIDFYHDITQNTRINFLVDGFYTRLNNVFTHKDQPDGVKLIVNAKGKSAEVYGVNFETRLAYRTIYDLQLGMTLQKSMFAEAQEPLENTGTYREFMRTPNSYGYFVSTWSPVKPFSFIVSGNYTGGMYVPHEAGDGVAGVDRFTPTNKIEKVNSFFELNTKLSYDFVVFDEITLQINGGVQNIFNAYQKDFDTGAGRASSYIYGPGSPRNVFAGLKIRF